MTDSIRSSLEWLFMTRQPPGQFERPFLVELYGKDVQNMCDAYPDFAMKLRDAALLAIEDGDPDPALIRQALQAMAHVAQYDDLPRLQQLLNHTDQLVIRDARTCIFQITHKGS